MTFCNLNMYPTDTIRSRTRLSDQKYSVCINPDMTLLYPSICIIQIQLVLNHSYNTQAVSIQIWHSCIPQYVSYRYSLCWLSAIILRLYQSRYDTLVSLNVSHWYNSISNSMFIIILRRCKYSCICIVQIQLNLELKIPEFVSYRYNSISNSRFLNLYLTDTTQSRSQDS